MHELSIARSIVSMVEDRARAEGARRVTRVGLAIGVLGHVEPEALEFCLASAVRGTLLDGSVFDIRQPAGRGFCFDCGREVEVAARGAPCPSCGGYGLRVASGDELKVTHMEIE